jgi:hypothetical protein
MNRPQTPAPPELAVDATSGVESARVIGAVSLSVNGIETHLLPLELAGGPPNAGSMPGLCIAYLRMHREEVACD